MRDPVMDQTADLNWRGEPRKRRKKEPRPRQATKSMMGAALFAAYQRAVRRGDPFDLEEIDDLVETAGGRCQVTGIPFSDAVVGECRTRPWVPTVDRIDATKGYVKGNMRLVCWAANLALADWGDDVFWTLVEAAYRKRHGDG